MPAPRDLPLDAVDATKLGVFLAAGFVAMIVPLGGLMLVGDSLAPPLDSLAPFLGLGAGVLACAPLLLFGRKAVHVRRFLLRLGDGRLDLLSPSGERLASSTDGTLHATAVNWVRRGKHGSRTHAGVRVRGGSHDLLITGLHPDPAWEQAETDGRTPAFELEVGAFEALKRVVDAPATLRSAT